MIKITASKNKLILGVLMLVQLADAGGNVNDLNHKLVSAEKSFNERQSRVLVMFMSLETMFPDLKLRALAKAAGEGNARLIEQLVEEGVDVNGRGTQGVTPLYWALRHYKGFRRLLDLGADPNVIYADGSSVMLGAVNLKDLRILECALVHGGNSNLTVGDSSGRTLIFDAIDAEMKTVDLLLKYGADINARDGLGYTPLLHAAALNDYEIVYRLLERGADFSLKDPHGYDVARHLSVKIGITRPGTKWAKWQQKVVEWLLDRGVKVSKESPKGAGGMSP